MTHFSMIYCIKVTVPKVTVGRTCIFHWAQKVSCERNNSVFISRLSLELNASRWVNIDLIFFNSLLCSGNVLLQPVCRS